MGDLNSHRENLKRKTIEILMKCIFVDILLIPISSVADTDTDSADAKSTRHEIQCI